jgi:hypothetical protein
MGQQITRNQKVELFLCPQLIGSLLKAFVSSQISKAGSVNSINTAFGRLQAKKRTCTERPLRSLSQVNRDCNALKQFYSN